MTKPTLSKYENISFIEAVKIIYYCFACNPKMLAECMADLITYEETPYKAVAPGWHESYKIHLTDNKNSK